MGGTNPNCSLTWGTVYVWTQDVPYDYTVFNEKKFWVNESGIIFKWDIVGPGTLTF